MAHVAGSKNFLVEQLNGDGYHSWQFRMQLILAEHEVVECIQKDIDLGTLAEEQKKIEISKNNKAISLIVQCVKDSQLESLREKTTAYKM